MTASSVKRVQFAEDRLELVQIVCEVPSRDDYGSQGLEMLFFTKKEYRETRASAKDACDKAEQSGQADLLRKSFAEKSKSSQNSLLSWTTGDHECRGLERWVCPPHTNQRQNDQFSAIMVILEAQQEMMNRKKIDHERLRKVASRVTRKARHFARMMGKADSYAVASMLKKERKAQEEHRQGKTREGKMRACSFWGSLIIESNSGKPDDEVSLTDTVTSSAGSTSCDSVNACVEKFPAMASLLSSTNPEEWNELEDDLSVGYIDHITKVSAHTKSPETPTIVAKPGLFEKMKRRLSNESSTRSRAPSISPMKRRLSTEHSGSPRNDVTPSMTRRLSTENPSPTRSPLRSSIKSTLGMESPTRTRSSLRSSLTLRSVTPRRGKGSSQDNDMQRQRSVQ